MNKPLTKSKLIFCVFFLLFSLNIHAQDQVSNQIIVEGNALIKTKPDIVTFTFTVEKTDTLEKKVLEKLNSEIENLIKTFTAIGFDDSTIKIADYNISSDFNNKNKKVYTASNTLTLTFILSPKAINELYKQIEIAKLSDVSLSFETSVSDRLEKSTRQLLIQQALADAESNANNIATTLHLKITGIKQVSKSVDIVTATKFAYNNYAVPKIVNDRELITNTPFDRFQVVEVDLNERMTVVYEISK